MSSHHKGGIHTVMRLFVGTTLVLQSFALLQPASALPFPPGPAFCEEGFEHGTFEEGWQEIYEAFCGGGGGDEEETLPTCGNGVKEQGEQCDGNDLDGYACTPEYQGGTLSCTAQCTFNFSQCTNEDPEEPEEPTLPVTVIAHKIICDDETYLPNWGEEGVPTITGSTALDFIAHSNGHCSLAPDWTFQWGFGDKEEAFGVDKLDGRHIGEADGTDSTGLCSAPWCGPNTFTGTGYSNWKTFGPTNQNGMASVTIQDTEDSSLLWVRENLKQGYIPFTYPPQGETENDVSAEIYCGSDTMNYDNYDYVSGIEDGGTFHCVAFNAPIQSQEEEPFCSDGTVDEGEQCDDGNTENGDGCSATCQTEEEEPTAPICGNSMVEQGEQCDDGNTNAGDGCNASCQTETTPGGGGSTGSATTGGGGGGGGGGGAIMGLTIYNEQTLSVTVPTALVSWFTNIPATTRVIYDTVSHDGTAPGPNYGYAFSTEHDPNKVTYHTVTLSGLTAGVRYYWRAISSASPEKMGIEVSFVASENPRVLGFQQGTGAGAGSSGTPSTGATDENVKVLGFEHLPDTGGDLSYYFTVVTMLASLILIVTGLGWVVTLRKTT